MPSLDSTRSRCRTAFFFPDSTSSTPYRQQPRSAVLYARSNSDTAIKLFLLFVCLLPALLCSALARPADWQVKASGEIRSTQLSADGEHVVVHTDTDADNVQCINTKTGSVVWAETLQSKHRRFLGKFVDNDVYVLAHADKYEFRAVADGKIIQLLPIAAPSWDELLGQPWNGATGLAGYPAASYEDVQPRFFGDVGIFYFNKGFQIVQLKKRTILYHSNCATSSVRYESWNSRVLVIPKDCGRAFVLDTASSGMVYSMELDPSELDDNLSQHFVATEHQMFLFKEYSILCINFGTKGSAPTTTSIVIKANSYFPVASQSDFYLVVSYSDQQTLYRCSDGELLWTTQEETVPGVVDFARIYNNGRELVMFTYGDGGKMGVHKLDIQTGQPLWSKWLFKMDRAYYNAGLLVPNNSLGLAEILLTGAGIATGMLTGTYFIPVYMASPNIVAMSSGIAPYKVSVGYAYLLDTANQSQLVIAMGGRIYTELQPTDEDEYDGEGFVVIDIRDGKILRHTQTPIIADIEKRDRDIYNAVSLMAIVSARQADIVVGIHDVYTVSSQRESRIPFDAEDDNIAFISSIPEKGEMLFSVDHDGEYYDYWQLNVGALPATKTLCARSTTKNFFFPDTTRFACAVEYKDGELIGYGLESGDTADGRSDAALWTISEDELDKMDIGDFRNFKSRRRVSSADSVQGIRIIDGDVYLLGKDGLGRISADGRCRWSVPWDMKRREWTYPLSRIGSYLVFSSGDDTGIIDITCDSATMVARHNISYGDVGIVTNQTNEIIVVDKPEGILYGYHAK